MGRLAIILMLVVLLEACESNSPPPVQVSVASGRVLSVTSDATNGRTVRVRHASGYVSQHLHLSVFAAGIRADTAIEQWQTVGRVGASGLATGPHLHYGLTKNRCL
jgi:murein DD-endopeptidase MepM/ murein hydrolase activator NlpD